MQLRNSINIQYIYGAMATRYNLRFLDAKWKDAKNFEIGPRFDMPPAGQVLLIPNQFIKKM